MKLQQILSNINLSLLFFCIALLTYSYLFKPEWLVVTSTIILWLLILIAIFLLVIMNQSKKEIEDEFKK